jgi:hypothetical protein
MIMGNMITNESAQKETVDEDRKLQRAKWLTIKKYAVLTTDTRGGNGYAMG